MAEIKDQSQLDVKIEEMFNKFDINKNGSIDEDELTKAMLALSPGVTKDVIHETFVSLDLDKNTVLSLDEFKNFVYKTLTS